MIKNIIIKYKYYINNIMNTSIDQTNQIITCDEIHMYKQSRGRNTDTVISGLIFKNNNDAKFFISFIKRKFGICGCQKMMEEIDKINSVYVFTGDFRDKISKILINNYNVDPNIIKKYG